MALGRSTPIGLCLFIARRIRRIGMRQLFRALWPFFLAETIVVILVMPAFAAWLPRLVR